MKGDKRLKEWGEVSKHQYIITPDEYHFDLAYQTYNTKLFVMEDNTIIITQQYYSYTFNKEYYNEIVLSPKQLKQILEIVRKVNEI